MNPMKLVLLVIILLATGFTGFVVSVCTLGIEVALQWFQGIVYLVAIVTASLSALQYYKNSKHARTKWLHELYRNLYGDPHLQDVLWRLETSSEEELKKLMEEDDEFGSRFDRFLNFFQFVAVLVVVRKELEMPEVMTMFKFPLKLILKRNAVVKYVREPKYDFRELCSLLDRKELQEAGQ